MKITNVRLEEVEGEYRFSGEFGGPELKELSLNPDYLWMGGRRNDRTDLTAARPMDGVYVHVDTDAGITGTFGMIETDQAVEINKHLRELLIGRDPLATEALWDLMARGYRHARRGMVMMAISAVDMALWDIRGKALGVPCYRLLGGPTRSPMPAYASASGCSLEPEKAARWAVAIKAAGFAGQKWFFANGPGGLDRDGMEKRVTVARAIREAVGYDVDLMFDAVQAWNVPFAVEFGKRIADLYPRWLEEPVPADHLAGYHEVRIQTGIPISGGEHEYTRFGFKALIDAEGVDVIQADPDWAGGLTEMPKIVALASTCGKQVIPHGHSIAPALHLVSSQAPEVCPWLEFLFLAAEQKQWFHKLRLKAERGFVRLPEEPGLGCDLDPERVLRTTALTWS